MSQYFSKIKKGGLILAAFFISACTFTVNNDLVKSHPENVEAYIQTVFDAFYEENTRFIMIEAKSDMGFTEDALIGMFEVSHETAKPSLSEIADRGFSQRNKTKYYVSLYHIPRERGRETLRITVTPNGDECCELYGLHLNMQLGPDFIMDTVTENEPTDEALEEITEDSNP